MSRNRLSLIFDLITLLFLVLTVGLIAVMVLILRDPYTPLNPFPPPTILPILELPTLTPVPTTIPSPTVVPTASATDSPTPPTPTAVPPATSTATFTPTLTPTFTPTPTITFTPVVEGVEAQTLPAGQLSPTPPTVVPSATRTPTISAAPVLPGATQTLPPPPPPTTIVEPPSVPLDDGSGNVIEGTGAETDLGPTDTQSIGIQPTVTPPVSPPPENISASDVQSGGAPAGGTGPTPTRSAFPFTASEVRYEPYGGSEGCNWLGIAGTVTGLDGAPLPGLAIEISGEGFQKTTFSGLGLDWGEAGFEFHVRNAPLARVYTLRIKDRTEAPLSDLIYVETGNTCQRNVAIVDFTQNHPFSTP